jgi:hypothetical protein
MGYFLTVGDRPPDRDSPARFLEETPVPGQLPYAAAHVGAAGSVVVAASATTYAGVEGRPFPPKWVGQIRGEPHPTRPADRRKITALTVGNHSGQRMAVRASWSPRMPGWPRCPDP